MSGETAAAARSFPFVVARGRSGTTLLRAMLDAHPDMAIPNESHFVVQFARRKDRYENGRGFEAERFTADLFEHWAFKRWELPPPVVLDAYEEAPPADYPSAIRTLYAAYAAHHGKSRYGDKTPSYVMSMDLLASTFPESRFVHLIRDGRDVTLSYLATEFGSTTLGQGAIDWNRFVRSGRAVGARLGSGRYLEVRYEELVAEPERVLGEVCAFVGLPYDDAMLRYHERADALVASLSHNESHRNLYRPPTAGLRDWRRELAPKQVAVFEALAGDLLDELGYERAARRPGLAARLTAVRYRVATETRRATHGARTRLRRLRRRTQQRGRRPEPPREADRSTPSSTANEIGSEVHP
jgi:hypothetical protein